MKRWLAWFAAVCAMALVLGARVGAADLPQEDPLAPGSPSTTVYLPAVADVTLAADSPFNFQDVPRLEVEYWHLSGALRYVRVFLVQFDLTGLPPGATIDSAILRLYFGGCILPGTYPVNLGAYYVNSPWSESDVTYDTRPSWASIGVNSQVDCPVGLSPTDWPITSFAQAWQADPAHNYGVKVSGPWSAAYDYSINWNSRELQNGPRLAVTYHLPAINTPTATPTGTSTPTPTRTRTPAATRTPTARPAAKLYLPLIVRSTPVAVVFNVTVPAATNGTGRPVYITGSFHLLDRNLPAWNPGYPAMTRLDEMHWTITLAGKESTQIEYNYTLGDWMHVERGAACEQVANRSLTLESDGSGTQTVNDTVLNWRNVAPCGD